MQHWLGQQGEDDLAISDWVVTEFSGTLSIKMRIGQIEPVHRAEILATFTRLIADSFNTLPVSRPDFRFAARLVDQDAFGLSAGDALHLAICAQLGATLCTLDRRLSDAATVLGIATMSL